jgi:Ribonuclease G/E
LSSTRCSVERLPTRPAAVLIDVDSGSPETGSPERIGLAVNLAAVDAIARQIRLRNLGGGTTIRARDRGRDRSHFDRVRFQIVPV